MRKTALRLFIGGVTALGCIAGGHAARAGTIATTLEYTVQPGETIKLGAYGFFGGEGGGCSWTDSSPDQASVTDAVDQGSLSFGDVTYSNSLPTTCETGFYSDHTSTIPVRSVRYTAPEEGTGTDTFVLKFDNASPSSYQTAFGISAMADMGETNTGNKVKFKVTIANTTATEPSNAVTQSETLKQSVKQTSGLVSRRIAQFTAPRPTPTPASPAPAPDTPGGGAPDNAPAPDGAPAPAGPTSGLVPGRGAGRTESGDGGGYAALAGPGEMDDAFQVSEDEQTVHLVNSRGLPAGDGMDRMGVWASASHSWLENDLSSTEYDGNLYTLVGGADYRFSEKLMGGLAVSAEWLDMDTDFNNGSQDTTGYQVTPYGALMLLDGSLVVDAMAGYGWMDSDVDRKPGATRITGSYDGTRWMLNANATYYHLAGPWVLSGKLGYMTAHQETDAYTESNGTRQPEQTATLGEIQAGGKAAYSTGMWEPYAGATLLYDGVMTHTTAGATQAQPANDDTGVEGVLGLNAYPRAGITVGAEVTREFFREDTSTTSVSANVRWQF